MRPLIPPLTSALILFSAAMSAPALADEWRLTPSEASFEDTAFAVQEAIVGRGLVIDYISHTGDMLERTRGDVGSDQVLFEGAQIFLFCSASVSRQVMEADWRNLAFCPYAITVFQRPGEGAQIGYVERAAETMAPVNALLAEIVEEATF